MKLKEQRSGTVEAVRNDPRYPDFYAWVDVQIGRELIRLLVPQEIVLQKQLYQGKEFSWQVWKWQFLDVFLNKIQEITEDQPPSLDHLLPDV